MKLSEALLYAYAKKILGFAYEKTGNSYDAEDLAQEIMIQLLVCIDKETEIESLSSFVYTVCHYTWSKYLRRNKKHWNYLSLDETENLTVEKDTMLEAENRLLYEQLRKVISTYAKTQREIIIMHYYENKTTSEISRILGINDSTIRWYLGSIKKDLKEKINMSEKKLDLRPVKMWVGIDGWITDESDKADPMEDLLEQNIAAVCYGEPLLISEISEKLNVASAYLEKHIEHMVYMDFLKQTGKRYQTNFFIKDLKVTETEIIYGYENAKPYADKIFEAVNARREEINSIDYFNKGDVDEDYFMWHVPLKTAQEMAYEVMFKVWKDYNITDRPLRKNGSKYWVIAGICNESFKGLNEGQEEYAKYRMCNGYKNNNVKISELYQADTYFLLSCNLSWRNITSSDEVKKFTGAVIAIRDKYYNKGVKLSEFTEYEKLMISDFIEAGYITVKDGVPVINIPVLTEEQMQKLNEIVEKIKNDLGKNFLEEYVLGFGRAMEPLIPSFLDKKIRNYHKYALMGGFDMFGYMIKEAKEGGNIKLRLPDGDAAKYALTMLVLKNKE